MIGKVSKNPLTGCLYPETVSGATAGTVNMLDFTDDDTDKPLVLAGCVSDNDESFVGKTDNGTFNSCLGVLKVPDVDAKINTTVSEASTTYDIAFISNSELKGGQTFGQVTLANVGEFTYNPATQTLSVCNICTNCVSGWNPFELKEVNTIEDLYGVKTQPIVFKSALVINGYGFSSGTGALFINCTATLVTNTCKIVQLVSCENSVGVLANLCTCCADRSNQAGGSCYAYCLHDCRGACNDQWVRQCCGVLLAHAIQFC